MSNFKKKVRNLVLVLGDQLNCDSSVIRQFNKNHDVIWMAEVDAEVTYVWNHKARIVLFLSAMRHFKEYLEDLEYKVYYRYLLDKENEGSFTKELEKAVREIKPEKLVMVEPGEWRIQEEIKETARKLNITLQILKDKHSITNSILNKG